MSIGFCILLLHIPVHIQQYTPFDRRYLLGMLTVRMKIAYHAYDRAVYHEILFRRNQSSQSHGCFR